LPKFHEVAEMLAQQAFLERRAKSVACHATADTLLTY
jgi:hypothetical protein